METYIEKQDEKLWVCTKCGKTTAGYDGDYLVSNNLHLSCHLKEEIKKEQCVKDNIKR
jgi:ribosomal protein L37AE/L43A